MNRIFLIALTACLSLSLFSCMDTVDAPDTSNISITAKLLPQPNSTLLSVKQRYSNSITGNNTFEQVKEDVIFEGVVVANDISGNLYQTLIIRDIHSTPGADDDQCISLGVKTTNLFSFFPAGQRIRVNLNGLYIGNYSRMPKIGRPYYTSAGNLRLGPMLLEDVGQSIQLIGAPNTQAPELTPRDFTTTTGQTWLADAAHRSYLNCPMLVSVVGKIKEVQGEEKKQAAIGALSGKEEPLPKIFAPKVLYDAGFGVDRTLLLSNSSTSITIRTSVRNAISYLPIPEDNRHYTGVLSYYSDWQLQLRSLEDLQFTH